MKTTDKILFMKKIYCLLFLFCTVGVLQAQIVFIPDGNFKNKLLEASPSNIIAKDANGNNITIDTNGDNEIQETEALSVYELDVYASEISDLSGIEYFVNLINLNCSENNLTQLDLSSNPNLRYMWVIHNPDLSYVNVKNGSAFPEDVGDTDWIHIWGNLPNYCYVCADEFEIAHIAPYLNIFSTYGKHVSSYCTFYPGGNYNTITGTLLFDTNNDGGCDALDRRQPFLKITTTDGFNYNNSSFTDDEGNYVFYTQTGVFPLSPQIENPGSFHFLSENAKGVFPLLNNEVETINICISANGAHPDLEVVISPLIPARPGAEATYKVVYRNKGNQTLSGNLYFYFDDAHMDLVSSDPNANGQAEGQLGYNFTNLAPFETGEIVIALDVNTPTDNPNVNIGDILSFRAKIQNANQLDDNPDDNIYELNQVVVDSYDPNDIICIEGDVIGIDKVGEELHYLVRFENTGNYPAENIVIDMEIDPEKYDVSSVRLLNTSHSANARITGNKLEIFFVHAKMESGGHGNILLVMNTNEGLSEGDFVKIKANIHFDYNYPVNTGDATTFIENLMATADANLNASVSIYPNPVKDKLTISSEDKIKSMELFDINGSLIRTVLINDNTSTHNLHSLNSGIYVLRIQTDKGTIVQKIIKQ